MNFKSIKVKNLKRGNLFFFDRRLYVFEDFTDPEYPDDENDVYPIAGTQTYLYTSTLEQ